MRLNLEPLIRRKSMEIYKSPDKLSQKDIAAESGIPQGTLSRWINGKVDSYKAEHLSALMNYFKCGVEDLFEIEYAAPVTDEGSRTKRNSKRG